MGEKPFPCELCGVGFGTSFELVSHEGYLHAGVPKHECEECGKLFSGQAEVSNHLKEQHSVFKYPKPKCGNTKRSQEALDMHFNAQHRASKKKNNQKFLFFCFDS